MALEHMAVDALDRRIIGILQQSGRISWRELADAAYAQMLELPYYNTFFKTATPPAVLLAAKVAEIAGGDSVHDQFRCLAGMQPRGA